MMRPLAIAFAFALGACGNNASPTHPTNSAATGTLDEARAYERGRGVPRDYARAAEIYTSLCRNGHGSIEACTILMDWLINAHGVSRDIDKMIAILHELCLRDDSVSCAEEIIETTPVGDLIGDAAPPPTPPPPDPVYEGHMAKVREACKRGDGRACETVVYDIEGGPNDDKAEAARAKLYAVACDEGRVESCASVVPLFERCENTDDVATCEAEDVADWKTKNPMWARAAQTLIDACNAGDALACVHVPSKRVPLTARCAANDYEACGLLGCLGVTDSAAIAKQHNAEVNCQIAQRLGGLESRRGTLPKTAHVSGTVDGGAM